MSAMAWQAGAASGPFIVGTLLRSLIELNTESYMELAGTTHSLSGWLPAWYISATATEEQLCRSSRISC
jgi:hypothetical protein